MPIFKQTKCRMKWCYSPLRHEDGTCDKICTYNTIHVQTNADRIRAMSDKELAEMIETISSCELCPVDEGNLTWLDWLKQEVEK